MSQCFFIWDHHSGGTQSLRNLTLSKSLLKALFPQESSHYKITSDHTWSAQSPRSTIFSLPHLLPPVPVLPAVPQYPLLLLPHLIPFTSSILPHVYSTSSSFIIHFSSAFIFLPTSPSFLFPTPSPPLHCISRLGTQDIEQERQHTDKADGSRVLPYASWK